MKTAVYFDDFRHAFNAIRPNNFSHEALKLLFDYVEEYENDSGEEIELDIIDLCCNFTEDYFQNIADQYGFDLSKYESNKTKIDAIVDYLSDQGVYVGEVGECIVYRNF